MPRPTSIPRDSTRRRLTGALVPLTVVVALLVGAAPAHADEDGTEATGSSAGDLATQQTETQRLQQQAVTQQDQVSAAQAALLAAATRAGAALEASTVAGRELDAAQLAETRQQQTLAVTQQHLDEGRDDLARWARSAYTGRSALDGSGLVETVLNAHTTDEIGANLVVLRLLGEQRADVVRTFAVAQAAQASAQDAAEQAAVRAADAAVAAASARDTAQDAVQTQKTVLASARSALADTQTAITADAAKQQANALALGQADAVANVVSGEIGDCAGADTSSYPNGQIPLTALCPLWGTSQHRLRADAANGFNQLSHAYAEQFGTPICVTDSYRTYAQQVDLKHRKPTLAATPGTSNHGWGKATDLCGGIQDFGSVQHRWMTANAPLYGWFHPAWAQAGGSKPEPWHWEYGG